MVTLEFTVLTERFPRGFELLRLRFEKIQLPLTRVADVQEPFMAKLMVPLSAGMLKLSCGVKVASV